LGERLLCKQDVIGSSPLASTSDEPRSRFVIALDSSGNVVYTVEPLTMGAKLVRAKRNRPEQN
jgi:hypothetical protein